MTWYFHHLDHCIVKPGHNRSLILHGSFLTRLESLGSIAHVVTYLISQPQFLTLHDVTRKVYRVLLATLQPLLAPPKHIAQLVVPKLKPLRQLQRAKEPVKQLPHSGLQLLPQRALALRELLKRLLRQPAEQLVHGPAPVLLIALGTLSVPCGIIHKGSSIHALLQVLVQMAVHLVQELAITLLAHKLTKSLMGNGLMRRGSLGILHVPVVRKHHNHLSGLRVIPALAPAPARLHGCIGVRDFVHVLNDMDVRVQFLSKLLHNKTLSRRRTFRLLRQCRILETS